MDPKLCTTLIGTLSFATSAFAATIPLPAKPACGVALVNAETGTPAQEIRARVSGREILLGKGAREPQELIIFPNGPKAVLVAYAGRTDNGPYGGDTLWRIWCEDARVEEVLQIHDADFGHAALSLDGRSLFFTGGDGIFRLDLKTGTKLRLTRASFSYCRKNEIPTLDVVAGFINERDLAFERGCGLEWAWHAEHLLLRDPGTSRMTTLPAVPPLTSVVVDAEGAVWAADETWRLDRFHALVRQRTARRTRMGLRDRERRKDPSANRCAIGHPCQRSWLSQG